MAICNNCGASVPDGKAFCGACGARLNASDVPAAPAQADRRTPPPPMFYPEKDMRPPKGTRYAPMGVGAFLGMILLMMIPVVNLILLIVWACGGCRNQNKRNYARAMLILMAIVFILDIALMALLVSLGVLTPDTFYDIASSLPA